MFIFSEPYSYLWDESGLKAGKAVQTGLVAVHL